MRKPSKEAAAALKAVCKCPKVSEAGLAEGIAHARSDLRTVLSTSLGYEFDLRDVTDKADREEGVEEALQKLGALSREGRKLMELLDRVLGIGREIDREIPKIAERLGVEL